MNSSGSDPRPPVPFTVLGGFLGAGKTTLLNHLLGGSSGVRVGVIVNDFGSVAVDADLVRSRTADTIALANGCICCAVGTEFATALPLLLDADPPLDRVVVEASGVADPGAVAQYGTLPGWTPDGVIVVVDAEALPRQLADPRIGDHIRRMVGRSHVLVLNKVDLIDNSAREQATRTLRELAPATPVVPSCEGQVAPELLWGARSAGPDDATATPSRPPASHPIGDPPAARHPAVAAITYRAVRRVDSASLTGWLDEAGVRIVRAKGILSLVDRPEGPTEIHVVGSRRSLRRAPDGVGRSTAGRLVVIGFPDELPRHPPPGMVVDGESDNSSKIDNG